MVKMGDLCECAGEGRRVVFMVAGVDGRVAALLNDLALFRGNEPVHKLTKVAFVGQDGDRGGVAYARDEGVWVVFDSGAVRALVELVGDYQYEVDRS